MRYFERLRGGSSFYGELADIVLEMASEVLATPSEAAEFIEFLKDSYKPRSSVKIAAALQPSRMAWWKLNAHCHTCSCSRNTCTLISGGLSHSKACRDSRSIHPLTSLCC